MTRLIRTELLKLRTMRLTYGLLGVAGALNILFALLENSRAGSSGTGVPPLSTAAGLRTVTTVTGFAMLFAAVLGAIAANGEFRHATATLTYLATPRRARVLVAKAIAAASFGSLFGLMSGIISTGVGLLFVAAHGDRVALSAETLAGHVGGAVAGGAVLAALGVGLGSLVRSQLATIIGIFVWAIVIESIVGGLYTAVRPLPALYRGHDFGRHPARQRRLRPRPRRDRRRPAPVHRRPGAPRRHRRRHRAGRRPHHRPP